MHLQICASLQIYKIKKSIKIQIINYNFTSLQIASMQNHHITKLPNIKLQSYKLHVLICKFQIYKLKK